MPCAEDASWTRRTHVHKIRQRRHHVLCAVHNSLAYGPRAPELFFTAFMPIHSADPKWAGHWRHLRLLSLSPDNRELLRRCMDEGLRLQVPTGRFAMLLSTLGLAIDWDTMEAFNDEIRLPMSGSFGTSEQHRWRDLLRHHELCILIQRCPDFEEGWWELKGGGTTYEGKLGHEFLENCCPWSLRWIFVGGPPREECACHHCQTEGPTALGFWNTQDQLFIAYSNQRVAAKATSREISQTCLLPDKAGCVTVLATFLRLSKMHFLGGGENVWGGGHFGGGGKTYG